MGRSPSSAAVVDPCAPPGEHRRVRDAHGGTVNDVILATVTGALRGWLMTRSESLGGLKQVRALVPVSVHDHELEATSLGTRSPRTSSTCRRRAEPGDPAAPGVLRLQGPQGDRPGGRRQPDRRHRRLRAVDLPRDRLPAGRSSSSAAGSSSRVTNVPGPQFPLYAAGAQMEQTYAVPPLLPGQALAIGVTSYDGTVFYGVTADRDLVPDADVFATCLDEALDELLDTVGDARPRVPRGRRTKAVRKP